MHLALASKLFCCASVIGGGGAPCGRSLAHAPSADWNAGESGLMLDGRLTLPFALRIREIRDPVPAHAVRVLHALRRGAEVERTLFGFGFAEDSHTATATAQPTRTRASLRICETRMLPSSIPSGR